MDYSLGLSEILKKTQTHREKRGSLAAGDEGHTIVFHNELDYSLYNTVNSSVTSGDLYVEDSRDEQGRTRPHHALSHSCCGEMMETAPHSRSSSFRFWVKTL